MSSVFLGARRIDAGNYSRGSSPVFWDSQRNTVEVAVKPRLRDSNNWPTAWRGRYKLAAQPSLSDLEFAYRLAGLYAFEISEAMMADGLVDLDRWALLHETFWRRAVAGHCEFKQKWATNRWLDVMLRSAQLTYEGRRPRHAIIITANHRFTQGRSSNWLVRFKRPIPLEQALVNEKWVRALVDGQRSLLIAQDDDEGTIRGLVSLNSLPEHSRLQRFLYGAEPNEHLDEVLPHLDDAFDRGIWDIESRPNMAHFKLPTDDDHLSRQYAPHLSLLPIQRLLDPFSLAMMASSTGDVFVIPYGGSVFRYSQGVWNYLHYATLHRAVEPFVGSIFTTDLLRLLLDLSFEHTGSLIVIVKDAMRDVLNLVPDFDHAQRPNRGLRDALRGQSVREWGVRQLVASAAAVDGAIILDRMGQILDVACMIGPAEDSPTKNGKLPPGSRSQAAKRASKVGIAFKVSSDGQLTCYRDGDVFFTM